MERGDQAGMILSGYYAAAGQNVCDMHDEGDICCGNEAMRRRIADLIELPESEMPLPYDQDPNAKPDDAAIRAFFCPADPDDAPQTLTLELVCGKCGAVGRAHEPHCPRAVRQEV